MLFKMKNIKFKSPNDFKNALKDAVEKKLGTKRTGNKQLYIKAGILLGSFAILYSLLVFSNLPPPINGGMCVIVGLIVASIGFNIMHDGNHGSFSKSNMINKIVGHSLNILGGNATIWIFKHNKIHHTLTNIIDEDSDIDFGPLARISPEQK